jgi:hypothetical protein
MVWVVSLSCTELIPRALSPEIRVNGIRSLVGFGNLIRPLAHPVLYLRDSITRGSTQIDFGENQLSPSLISLSPLPTAHPSCFQPTPVRASTTCYRRFTLAMGRSLGFGSAQCNSNARLGLAFATATRGFLLTLLHWSNSPAHYAKGTQSEDGPEGPPSSYRL